MIPPLGSMMDRIPDSAGPAPPAPDVGKMPLDGREGLKEPASLPTDAVTLEGRDAIPSEMSEGVQNTVRPMMNARHTPRPGGDRRPPVTASNLLECLDLDRSDFPKRPAADSGRRAELGQFFTPIGVARFMASMLQVREPPANFRILDPGGGCGILTAAAVAELCSRPERSRPAALHATVWELDARLADDLDRTFEHWPRGMREGRGHLPRRAPPGELRPRRSRLGPTTRISSNPNAIRDSTWRS